MNRGLTPLFYRVKVLVGAIPTTRPKKGKEYGKDRILYIKTKSKTGIW